MKMAAADLAHRWARLPTADGALASPDGHWAAWNWPGAERSFEIFVAPTDGAQAPIALSDQDEFLAPRCWLGDNCRLVVARHNGDDRAQLLLYDRRTPGTARALVAEQHDYYIGGVAATRDDRALVFPSNLDPANGQASEHGFLIALDLASGAIRALARMENFEDSAPQISPDGRWIVYGRCDRHPGGRQAWLMTIDGSADRELLNVGDARRVDASWLPDSRRLLIAAERETHVAIAIYDFVTDETRWLIDDPARFVEKAVADWDGRGAAIVECRGARSWVSWLDLASGREVAAAPGDRTMLPLEALPGGAWLASHYRSDQPTDFVRLETSGKWRTIGRAQTRFPLPAANYVRAEDFRWRGEDGLEIQGWLYRTRQAPALGTILYVHGGPNWHKEDEADGVSQFLAAADFNVLDPNYRGSTGNGILFREAIKKEGWGGAEQRDIWAGAEALIAAGIAQRGKIGIFGNSYGGYSAWCAAAWAGDLFAAAAPMCGMTELTIDYAATGMPHGRLFSEAMMGGTPEAAADLYRARSPVRHFDKLRAKLLVIHGARDTNVSPRNSELAMKALDDAGYLYRKLLPADEGHGIWRPRNRAQLFEQLAAFFEAAFAPS